METCAFCKTIETELYLNGVPICIQCSEEPKRRTGATPPPTHQTIRNVLLHDILEATALNTEARAAFEALMDQGPSGLHNVDGTQLITNASNNLSNARRKLMLAHTRLDEFLEHGIVPEDLKGSA